MLKLIGTSKTHMVQQVIFGKGGEGAVKYQIVPLDENNKPIHDAKQIHRFNTLKEADEIAGLTKPSRLERRRRFSNAKPKSKRRAK